MFPDRIALLGYGRYGNLDKIQSVVMFAATSWRACLTRPGFEPPTAIKVPWLRRNCSAGACTRAAARRLAQEELDGTEAQSSAGGEEERYFAPIDDVQGGDPAGDQSPGTGA
jgi:hypothetical protein